MERIQERALRFIYDDHNTSYEDLLMKSKGQITISSDPSPLVGIQFLAIPSLLTLLLRCISKKKASNTQ